MTHDQLIVAQAEAFTILCDLMHLKPDDPRPQRIINTIKQAALAILRLKPVAPAAAEHRPAACGRSDQGNSAQRTQIKPTLTSEPREADLTAHLSDEQFKQLVTHLPDLNPATDKHRMRLARYLARFRLGVTPEVKAAIFARAERIAQSLQRELTATARAA